MEDAKIRELFFSRNEEAIRQCDREYGRLVRYVASRILGSENEAEEVASDTWLKAWNTIPPNAPERLGPYLAMLARQTAIDRLRSAKRLSRGGGAEEYPLEELEGIIPDVSAEGEMEADAELSAVLTSFLKELRPETRRLFLRRYWWGSSVKEVAEEFGISQNAVKTRLSRTRFALKRFLRKEGYDI